jgi:CDP-diacylglycerol---glycerol-3-phosphate 3-phosphatidyltransferase
MTVPNQLTTLRIILTPVFLFFLFGNSPGSKQVALIVFLIAALTDWYDGLIARKYRYQTKWGRFLDPLADKILTSSAFIGFLYLGLAAAWMVWLIVIRDILITILRSYAEYRGIEFLPSKGAKVKTGTQMVVLYYILILHTAEHTPALYTAIPKIIDFLLLPDFIYALMLVVTIFTVGTGIAYLYDNRKLIWNLHASTRKTTEPN